MRTTNESKEDPVDDAITTGVEGKASIEEETFINKRTNDAKTAIEGTIELAPIKIRTRSLDNNRQKW